MCFAIPMQLVEKANDWQATCKTFTGELIQVDLRFLDKPKIGDWLLVSLGSARESVSEAYARKINDAHKALDMIMQDKSANTDHLFFDLIDSSKLTSEFK